MRHRIEEMLKVAEKEYSSVKFLSDSKSFMKMKIAQAKIQLLTSLLAENGGEVKEVNIVELGDIANRAVQEVLNQGGKLTSEEQFALTQMFIELGEVFHSKLPSAPSKGETE